VRGAASRVGANKKQLRCGGKGHGWRCSSHQDVSADEEDVAAALKACSTTCQSARGRVALMGISNELRSLPQKEISRQGKRRVDLFCKGVDAVLK
jgi:hypothetical protein